MSFRPSALCTVAPTGQTSSHGAFSQCMHGTGWMTRRSGSSGSPSIVAVDADPVHLAPAAHLVLADDRDVVLRLAGDDAGVAADAGVEVDRHAPGVAVVRHAAGRASAPGGGSSPSRCTKSRIRPRTRRASPARTSVAAFHASGAPGSWRAVACRPSCATSRPVAEPRRRRSCAARRRRSRRRCRRGRRACGRSRGARVTSSSAWPGSDPDRRVDACGPSSVSSTTSLGLRRRAAARSPG